MRIVLLGATDLTLAIANAIEDDIVGVVTVPQVFQISYCPSGVTNTRFVDMASWAQSRELPVLLWNGAASAETFVRQLRPDWGLAAGWYHILSPGIRDAFPLGIAGLHASLLPRFRGNAPLTWALLARASHSGVSLFELVHRVDAGDLYGQVPFEIGERDTIATLIEKSTGAALELVRDAVARHRSGPVTLVPQEGEPTYCLQRVPADGEIDWTSTADDIHLLVRATTRPYPGAFSRLDGERITIWRTALVLDAVIHGRPGQICRLDDERVVALAADGPLQILEAELDDGGDALPHLAKASQRRFSARPGVT